jgi:hypothetical protein
VRDTLARLIGASGSFKSFVLLDVAACVANGRSWHGAATKAGPVVIVAAEGASGLKQRLAAWRERHGLTRHGLIVLPRPVQVAGPEWRSFVARMADMRPALIGFDTQARVSVGRNENDAREMGEVVEGLEELRVATAACVLVVHHTGKSGQERGSTAPFGAASTSLDVRRVGDGMTIEIVGSKQKDDVDAPPLLLTMNKIGNSLVPVGQGEALGADGTPLLFVAPANQTKGRTHALALVSVLREYFAGSIGGTYAEIRDVFMRHRDVATESVNYRKDAWYKGGKTLESAKRIARNPVASRPSSSDSGVGRSGGQSGQ